jgi:photosystem II stability/assembly factor-like uncharacterized protein
MKNLISITLALLMMISTFAQSPNWRQVNTNNAKSHFLKMDFVNDTLGYATTYMELLISFDEGESWNIFYTVDTAQNFVFENMYLLADSIYFFAHDSQTDSNYTVKVKSGLTNVQVKNGYNLQPPEISAISFKDSIWSATNSGLIAQRNNQYRTIDSNHFYNDLSVWKETYLAASTTTNIHYSDDSGITWSTAPLPFTVNYPTRQVFNFGGDTLLFHKGGFPLFEYITYDGGLNWIQTAGNSDRPFKIVPFNKSKKLIATKSGLNTEILTSINLGYTYTSDSIGVNILNYFQRDDSTFFALCANGILYKSTNTGGIVGLREKGNSSTSAVQISPNPAQDKIKITVSNLINVTEMRMLDMNGKVVYESARFKSTINIGEFKSGIYFVELSTEKGKIQKKFVKQ